MQARQAAGISGPPGPYVLNLGSETWDKHLDAAEEWLNNVITAQHAFRSLLEDTLKKIEKPNIRLYLSEMLETARRHEAAARDLPRTIGRQTDETGRGLAGAVVAGARKVVGTVEGLAGGAKGDWRDIRELLIANLDAMGGFAVAEQLGLALANAELRGLAFQVTAEKSSDQLVLQELMLEMASVSILYGEQV
jgi:hypothetical protein